MITEGELPNHTHIWHPYQQSDSCLCKLSANLEVKTLPLTLGTCFRCQLVAAEIKQTTDPIYFTNACPQFPRCSDAGCSGILDHLHKLNWLKTAASPLVLTEKSHNTHQLSLLIWSPKPGVSTTVNFIFTPPSSITAKSAFITATNKAF